MKELDDCGKRWEGWRFADLVDPSQGLGYHSCLWDCKEGFQESHLYVPQTNLVSSLVIPCNNLIYFVWKSFKWRQNPLYNLPFSSRPQPQPIRISKKILTILEDIPDPAQVLLIAHSLGILGKECEVSQYLDTDFYTRERFRSWQNDGQRIQKWCLVGQGYKLRDYNADDTRRSVMYKV